MSDKTHSLIKTSSEKEQGKFQQKPTQLQTIFAFLQDHVATASMVSDATGIPRPNITRFKRDLELKGHLAEIEKKLCQITGHRAFYLTTNSDLFPKSNQYKLFGS